MKIHKSKVYPIILLALALITIMGGLLIPDGVWRPPSVSSRIGPNSYSSDVSNQPVVVASVSGNIGQPETVTVRFQYRAYQRPRDFAYIIATSDSPDGGVRVAIEESGYINLGIESRDKSKSPYQLIRISSPHDLGKWVKISIFIDKSLGIIRVEVDDQRIAIVEARVGYALQINDMLLTTSSVQIGGADDRNFAGEIRDFEMSFGTSGIKIDLINLKLFLGMAALFLIGVFILERRKVN